MTDEEIQEVQETEEPQGEMLLGGATEDQVEWEDVKYGDIPEDVYSEAVRKRIGKEVGKRKELQDRLDAEVTAREDAMQKLAAMEERIEEREKAYREREAKAVEDSVEGYKAKAGSLRKAAQQAMEEGEIEKAFTLLDEATDAKLEVRMRQAQKPEPKPEPKQEEPQGAQMHPAARRWLAQNRGWFQQPGFTRDTDEVFRLQEQLVAQGKPYSDEFFEEIDSALRSSRKPKGPPPAPSIGGPPGRKQNSGISRASQAMLKELGLDPSNDVVRKAYQQYNNREQS